MASGVIPKLDAIVSIGIVVPSLVFVLPSTLLLVMMDLIRSISLLYDAVLKHSICLVTVHNNMNMRETYVLDDDLVDFILDDMCPVL